MKKLLNNFFIALMTLTRFRIPFQDKILINDENLKNSAIFYPIIGLIYGLIQYFCAYLLLKVRLKLYFVSFVVLIVPYMINKFFHFDGLCDLLDGFLADKDFEDRLRIMKEPTIGSFALGGAIFFILLKFLILLEYFNCNLSLLYIIMIPVYSRFSIIFLSYNSKYPRDSGTGKFIIGKVNLVNFLISLFITLLIGIIFEVLFFKDLTRIITLSFSFLILFVFLTLFKKYSNKKINGITGDVLGAAVEISEIFLFIIILVIENYVFI